jgi:3-hydroxyisobutyrate dehydrogenase-like beta-hydroxyacid dehydrogenase
VAIVTGFIGLGAMGSPMALCLLKAGIPLVVYDIDAEKSRLLGAAGARIAASPAEVAALATRIVCMVSNVAQVRAVLTGADGVMNSARAGHRIVFTGTIAPQDVTDLHAELAHAGVMFTDAPVSGGVERALAGTLAIYASGDSPAIDAFRDVFDAMGGDLFVLGKVGQGMALKLINNMLVQINTVAVAEAMTLGAGAGIDPQVIYDAVKVSTGYSVAFEMRVPRIIARDFKPGGILDISYKDQELETAYAKQLGVPMFLAPITQQIFQLGHNMGLGSEDAAAIIKVYENLFQGV